MADCSELSKLITELTSYVSEQHGAKDIDGVLAGIHRLMPEYKDFITRQTVVDALIETSSREAKEKTELQKRLADIKKEAKDEVGFTKAIERISDHLEKGTLPEPKKKGSAEKSQYIKDLEDVVNILEDKLKNSPQAKKKKLQKQIDYLKDKIARGDFMPAVKPKENTKSDKELARLEYELYSARESIKHAKYEMKEKTFWEKTIDRIGLVKAIQLGLEFSFVGMQGGIHNLSEMWFNPNRGVIDPLSALFKSFFDAQKAYEAEKAIQNDPYMPLAAKAKLHMPPVSSYGALTTGEESIPTRLLKRITFGERFHRATILFLETQRLNMFKTLLETSANGLDTDLETAKAIAMYVNIGTGRISMGSLDNATDVVNVLLLAPRWLLSRFAFITGTPLIRAGIASYKEGNTQAIKAVGKQYAKYMIGLSTILGLAVMAGAEPIDLDPRSRHFLKIRYKGRSYDVTSGLSSAFVFLFRSASSEQIDKYGRVVDFDPIRGTANYVRQKLAPFPSAYFNWKTGKFIGGNEFTFVNQGVQFVTPITYRSLVEDVMEYGVDPILAVDMVTLFGVAMNREDE